VASFSTTAEATTRILKDKTSLTNICIEHANLQVCKILSLFCVLQKELEEQKKVNAELERALKAIVDDLNEKAPELVQQKELLESTSGEVDAVLKPNFVH